MIFGSGLPGRRGGAKPPRGFLYRSTPTAPPRARRAPGGTRAQTVAIGVAAAAAIALSPITTNRAIAGPAPAVASTAALSPAAPARALVVAPSSASTASLSPSAPARTIAVGAVPAATVALSPGMARAIVFAPTSATSASVSPAIARRIEFAAQAILSAALGPAPPARTITVGASTVAAATVSPLVSGGSSPSTAGPYETMHDAIRSRVGSVVEDSLGIPVAWPNEATTPPTLGLWAEVVLEHVSCERIASGRPAKRYRKAATLRVVLRQRLGIGDGAVATAARQVRDGLQDAVVSGVRYHLGSLGRSGREERSTEDIGGSGSVWRVDVVVQVTADDDTTPDAARTPAFNVHLDDALDAIRTRFGRDVADPQTLPTAYDNQSFTPPAGLLWAMLHIELGSTADQGVGALRHTALPGVAFASLFSPLGIGESAALTIADAIVLRFRDTHESGVTFDSPTVRTPGRSGAFWHTSVAIPFRIAEVT